MTSTTEPDSASALAQRALSHELLGVTYYAHATMLAGPGREQLLYWLRMNTEQTWAAAQNARERLTELRVAPLETLLTPGAATVVSGRLEAELALHESAGIELYERLAQALLEEMPPLAGGVLEQAARKRIRRAEALAFTRVPSGTPPPFPLDGTKRDRPVPRATDEPAVRAACAALAAAGSEEQRYDALARLLEMLVHPALRGAPFRALERRGIHVTPVHFYQPLPDTGELADRVYESVSTLRGIELNEQEQLRLAREVFPRFRAELDALPVKATSDPRRYYLDNAFFSANDAFVYWCLLRSFRPRRVIEVGAGFSSRLAAEALAKNGFGELTCIEPYPDELLQRGIPGITRLLAKPVQEVPLGVYEELGRDDILFIDSSHVVKSQSDVNWLFFEVLPRLRPGVLVHVHDIYLPREYPKEWLTERLHFWNEQYLLQAFLMFNSSFEVLFANTWMQVAHPEAMLTVFPKAHGYLSGSFWIRRRS